MKIFAGIICLFLPAFAFSQIHLKLSDTLPANTVMGGELVPSDKTLVVIDGSIFYGNTNTINPNYILSVDVLKRTDLPCSNYKAPENTILIVTRQRAIDQYQKKFAKSSKWYQHYIKHNNGQDSSCLYMRNGHLVTGKSDSIILKLFHISSNKIKSVNCSKNPDFRADNKAELVAITTVDN